MNQQFHLKKEERDRISAAVAAFLQNQPNVDFAYLFGSFVEEGAFSDIDIAVMFAKDVGPMREVQLERQVSELIGYPVEAVGLNRAPLSFRFRVISTGRLLMERDDNRRCDFEERAMVLYADMKPFYQRWYGEVVLGSG